MNFVEKHKALLITSLITGTLVLAMFSFSIKKKTGLIAESYYEIEPQTEEEIKALERLKALEEVANNNPKTNEAFNEDEEFKEMMRNFKSMSSFDDVESPRQQEEAIEETSQSSEEVMTSNSTFNANTYALKDNERSTFNKANDILAMHSNKKDASNSKSNSSSSVSFSLSKRTKVDLPPPVYLCETAGKIVVNITVNSQGQVTDTYINSSSSSDNQCLIDTALEYAKDALFSTSERKSQIGSITYYFQGK